MIPRRCRCIYSVSQCHEVGGNNRPPPRDMTSRNFVFTLNNPDQTLDWSLYKDVTYAIWQYEIGENGTIHIQGYLELSKSARRTYLHPMLKRAYLEKRKGTRDQARDYCRKEESRVDGPFEYGTWHTESAGRRTDLLLIKDKIDAGANEVSIAEDHFETWIKYYRGLREYKRIKTISRHWKSEVTVLVGEPGCGKSRKCMEELPDAYWKQRGQWWDGYEGQDAVVIDDYYGWLPFDTLLRLLDRYPMILETKGGHVEFTAKKIYITSNVHPENWYKNENLDIRALLRRIENLINI